MTLSVALAFLLCLSTCGAYRILVVFPEPGKDHSVMAGAFVDGLTKRGHDVTLVTANPNNIKNLRHREIFVGPTKKHHIDDPESLSSEDVRGGNGNAGWWFELSKFWTSSKSSDSVLEQPMFKRLLRDHSEKFDLVILEYNSNDAFIGLGDVFDCPVVLFTPDATPRHTEILHGGLALPSIVPTDLVYLPANMNIWQRMINTAYYAMDGLVHSYITLPYQERLFREHVSDACETRGRLPPSFDSRAQRIALILSNSHHTISTPVPGTASLVPIAGFHVRDTDKKLPQNIQSIMDESSYGVIYVDLKAKTADWTEAKRRIAEILSNRKETILWNSNGHDIPEMPPAILVKNSIPSRGVLAHPSVKLYIHHGEYLSALDSIHYAVPSIVFPTSDKQRVNSDRIVDKQISMALSIDQNELAQLDDALDDTLGPIYSDNTRKLSRAYHDRPMLPMDTAIHSIEHCIRQYGTKYFSNPSAHLAWHQYYLVDVILIYASTVLAIAYSMVFAYRLVSTKIRYYKVAIEKRLYFL